MLIGEHPRATTPSITPEIVSILNGANVNKLERTEVVVFATNGLAAAVRARTSSNDGDRAAGQSSLSGEATHIHANSGEDLSESRSVGRHERVAYAIENMILRHKTLRKRWLKKIRTALHGSGVAGVLNVASGDEDSHGGNGEQSELGEHFVG